MKRFSVLFIAAALALFALLIPASAESVSAPIDENEAAAFLGRWYLYELCGTESCDLLAGYGFITTVDVNPDNTMVFGADDEDPDINQWYMENGAAYEIADLGEGNTIINPMSVNEDGVLMIGSADDSYLTCIRNVPEPPALPAAVEAAAEDFAGEWHIYANVYEGWITPVGIFADDIVLTVGEEDFVLNEPGNSTQAVYSLENGVIRAVIEGKDAEGQPRDEEAVIDLREDGTLFFTFDPGTEDESIMVFTREKYVTTEDEFFAAFGLDMGEESGFSFSGLKEKLSDLLEKVDFSSLVQKLTGSENFDLSDVIRRFTGKEDFDINGFISKLTSGEGEGFTPEQLMEKLSNFDGNGEEGFSLGGLLEDLIGKGK